MVNTYPKIAKEWHPTKNEITPDKITYGSQYRVWWMCKNGHEWDEIIAERTIKNTGCPICSNRRINNDNNFAIICPKLLKEWNFKKNTDVSPYNIAPGARDRVWWICKKDHEWYARISARTGGNKTGCPMCSQNKSYSEIAIKWLDSIAIKENIYIQHAKNGGEYKIKIGKKRISFDGYCKKSNTVFSYNGCFFHSCGHKECRYYIDTCRNMINKKVGKTFRELYDNTVKRNKLIKSLGYNLISIQECKHKQQLKN